MSWNWRGMRAVVRKDLQQVIENRMVWIPMIAVPLVVLVLLPVALVLLPNAVAGFEQQFDDLGPFLEVLPETLRRRFEAYGPTQMWAVISANYLFAPMFLIVPLMVSSILCADSFAGERERKTLESLLYTPLTDAELFLAKLLVGFLPALLLNLGGFVLYGLVVNLVAYPLVQRLVFPEPIWWPLVFWVAPGVAVTGLGATVLISSRARGFMHAQQMSGMLVLPIVFLMLGQLGGLFFLGVGLLLGVGLAFWLVGAFLVWVGAKTFQRGELMARI